LIHQAAQAPLLHNDDMPTKVGCYEPRKRQKRVCGAVKKDAASQSAAEIRVCIPDVARRSALSAIN